MRSAASAVESLRTLGIGSNDGIRAEILPFGARLASLWVPSNDGPVNVVLGYPDPRRYAEDPYFLGCTVGRTSGRIAHSRFSLDGREYRLPANEGPHHLHGGPRGFHARTWDVLAHDEGAHGRVILGIVSRDGDEGYPGRLDATATFTIDADALDIELVARCDAPTPVSLTNHAYYNLSGDHRERIDDHLLTLNSGHFLELDEAHIPTGRRIPVEGSPFDFRSATRIGRSPDACEQLRMAGGYDHTFTCGIAQHWVAKLQHEANGLEMRLSANQPSLQVYVGQYLRPTTGVEWRRGSGICLEPQQLPNAINQPQFPSPVLRPGDTYRNRMRLTFCQP